ncbi:putative repeat protein (TIGR01451 family) [Pseudoxanthomonas japonensis]|uniref:prealbumin-like fold domain-containing protein n=1 Tax=Pseudoxanthomonas japonensis TaxID=69284 RepID=UPI002863F684|nr:hypothetical protein [Pseudoxanthomonas japonensis]MDR7067508.1 putative repeat protein (TIGR01451 family) [Pseudoxanthomonas japonensis]
MRLTAYRMLAMAALAGIAGPALAQQCGFGTYQSFAALNGQAGSSETVINGNNVYVGRSRVQVDNTTFGNGTITTDDISDNHYTGEPGIRIGHSSGDTGSEANRIQTTLHFRNPDNLSQYLPVGNLSFRLHDVDAGDRVRVNAYDQNGALITLTSSMYSFYANTLLSFAGSNLFQAPDGSTDALSNGRRGTVDIDLAGYQVSRIEFRYWDPNANGTYTIAQMSGCSVPLTLYKTTNPSPGGAFSFTLANTRVTTGTVTTPSAGTPTQVDGDTDAGMQSFTVAAPGSAVSISESSLPVGWTLVNAVCSNAAGATVGSRSGTTYTIPGAGTAAGASLTCTFTNARTTLRLQKALPGGRAQAADQFTLSIAGVGAPAPVTTTGSGTTANGLVTHATPTAGSTYTLSESAAGGALLGNYTTSYACTNTRTGGQTPSGIGTTFNVVPVAGDDLTCTFSNAARPRVTIRKTSVNGTGSFTFSGSNGIANQTLVTTVAGTPVSGAVQMLTAANTATTITEGTLPPNYLLTDIACTGLPTGGTATPNLASRQVVLNAAATVAGANVICTFTNTLQQADIQVMKTATPNPTLSGGVVTYTLQVTNNGPVAAPGTVVTDIPGAGLNCTTPSTTFTCAATGGATCPSATVPVSTLLGTGLVIPTLPVNGQVTATLQCTVTATGQP